MPDAQDRGGVDGVVQRLPVLPHTASYRRKRCCGKRGQNQQRRESNQYKWTFVQVTEDFAKAQVPVEDNPGRKVHQHIEKREQTQHAAKPRQPVPAAHAPQRRDRQRDHYESQPPVAEAIEDFFDGVCTQGTGQTNGIGDDKTRGKKTDQEYNGLPEKAYLLQRVQ